MRRKVRTVLVMGLLAHNLKLDYSFEIDVERKTLGISGAYCITLGSLRLNAPLLRFCCCATWFVETHNAAVIHLTHS